MLGRNWNYASIFTPLICSVRFLWHYRCCPGGFSSYILSKNLRSKGMGISLPVTSGGHEFLLEEDLRSRLYLHQADLTKYPLGLNVYHQQPFPVHTNTRPFDLILLDGHPLRTSPSIPGDNSNNQKKGAILLVSQLIIGLQSISLSGTVIMKLSKPERVTTAKVLYMFDMLSLQLASWKPVCMHATRDTFYIVAKGIGHGKMGCKIEEWIHGLKILWEELMLGSRERGLEKRDMDFIVSERELGTVYSERLEQLSRHIWLVQETSISGWKLAEGL